jgi:hypothetical protein
VFILKQTEATDAIDKGIYTVKRKNRLKL